MKQIYLLIFLLLSGVLSFGVVTTIHDAKQVAVNWLNNKGAEVIDSTMIKDVVVETRNNSNLYFIVSFDPIGWVMVSGNDGVEPILGYSLNTNFEHAKQPIQLQEWLKGIGDEITFSFSEDYISSIDIKNKWASYKLANFRNTPLNAQSSSSSAVVSSVGPLLTSTWDQGEYYNEMAPEDVSSSTGNGHVYIGCVATAMVQVMKFWEYPLSGLGSHSYVHPDYGLQAADFGNSFYNWSSMPDHLSVGNTEVQEISYHAAVGVDMDFDPHGSGAFLDDALYAMHTYFKYNTTLFESYKTDWDSEEAWEAQIKNELDNGRPIVYAGYNSNSTSGHAFVLDGYDGDYFHFNWGWGGYANGNFLLSSLRPGGSNYSHEQSAMFGIEPVQAAAITSPLMEGFEGASIDGFKFFGITSVVDTERHSGSKSIQLSSQSNSSHSKNVANLSFVVPVDGQLSFWVKRNTPDTVVFNNQLALLMPEWGDTELHEFYNGSFTDDDWVNYSLDISAYAGQTVRLMFIQQNFNIGVEQWMYVDDVTVSGIDQNFAPFEPSAPSPLDLSVNELLSPTLRWSGGDPNGHEVVYTVRFGTTNPPEVIATVSDNEYTLEDLQHSTTFYWQIYANDYELESIGPVWSFTTQGIPPTVETCGVSSIGSESATVCSRITNTNGANITQKGVCWSAYENPNIVDDKVTSFVSTPEYECEMTGLLPYRRYFYRAFADSDKGIGYSDSESFITAPSLAEVSLKLVDVITRSEVLVSGNLLSVNDSLVTNCGVVWSLNAGFDTLLANSVDSTGSWDDDGVFEISISDLPGPNIIYYRVYAENSVGVSYSDEGQFTLHNSAPFIDLDGDNSSGALGADFIGALHEQQFDGVIGDIDIVITDPDGENIRTATIILSSQISDSDEYLVYTGSDELITVTGNNSDTLTLETTGNLSNLDWALVLRDIVCFNNQDAPNPAELRKVIVVVNDGHDDSNEAFARMSVVPVNDTPVNQAIPALLGSIKHNNEISVQKGIWVDELDQCTGDFSYSYLWQLKVDTNIVDLAPSSPTYLVGSESCGNKIRVVETIVDSYCGGVNSESATVVSDWVEAEEATQTITVDQIPTLPFSSVPFVISGESSSGLPITYSTGNSKKFDIVGDTIFMKSVGRVAIVCKQMGNNCYAPSNLVYRLVEIVKGTQEIINNTISVVGYNERFLVLDAFSTAGMPLDIVSLDTSLASISADTIHLLGAGVVDIRIEQSGNENVDVADPVVFSLTIDKGDQNIESLLADTYLYGDIISQLKVSSTSELPVSIESSNSSVVEVDGGELNVVGVGDCVLSCSQLGNDLYNPAQQVDIPIQVLKGSQYLQVQLNQNLVYGQGNYHITALSSVGLPLTISTSNSTILDFVEDSMEVNGVGSVVVNISSDGSDVWMPADTSVSVEIIKGSQDIVVSDLLQSKFGDESFAIPVVINTGLGVDFKSLNTNVAVIENQKVKIVGVGEGHIQITQSGNEVWNDTSVVTTLVVDKGDQVISFNDLPDAVFGDRSVALTVSSSAGLDLTINSSNHSVAVVEDDMLLIKGAGETQVEVGQAGSDLWKAAATISKPFNVEKATQSISCTLPDTIYANQSMSISNFVVSSGLVVSSLVSSDNSIVKVSGDEIAIIGRGAFSIEATHNGNENYKAVAETFNFILENAVGVNFTNANSFNVYPNPVDDILNVLMDDNVDLPVNFNLLNALGQVEIEKELKKRHNIVELEDISAGVYFVVVSSASHSKIEKLIVK